MEEKIKPCPFCGGNPQFTRISEMGPQWTIFCVKCRLKLERQVTKEIAILIWNTRFLETSVPKKVFGAPKEIEHNGNGWERFSFGKIPAAFCGYSTLVCQATNFNGFYWSGDLIWDTEKLIPNTRILERYGIKDFDIVVTQGELIIKIESFMEFSAKIQFYNHTLIWQGY